jgi:hypothetical protein
MRRAAFALVLTAVVLATRPLTAAPWQGWERLENDLAGLLDEIAAERQARYPIDIDIRWQTRQIADFDFGAPVLAAQAVQLDGKGPEELVILTTTELIALSGIGSGRPDVVQRLALGSGLAAAERWPRDPRGEIAMAMTAQGTELRVRSSAMATGARIPVALPLKIVGTFGGYPACGESTLKAVPGRALLVGTSADLPAVLYAIRCGRDFFDRNGESQASRAVLDASGTLTLAVFGCQDGDCRKVLRAQAIADAGTAFAVADIDRDGLPELVAAGGEAPGDTEKLTIYESRPDAWRTEHRVEVKLGAVAVVIGQFDSDQELEVLSLHREFRTNPVELWLWN